MKRKSTYFIVLVILINALVLSVSGVRVQAAVITIAQDGSGDYSSINAAISAALPGDLITVQSGRYYENVIIDKSLSLIGEDRETTIIDGNGGSGQAITVGASDVEIANFLLYNARVGVRMISNRVTVRDCIIDTVNLRDSIGIAIDGYSAENRLFDNVVKRANLGIRMALRGGGGNYLRRNQIIERAQNILGMGFGFSTHGTVEAYDNDIDTSNTIDGKPIYLIVNQENLVISPESHPLIGYLALINCRNITVRDIPLECNYQGLLLAHTEYSIIENVIVNFSETRASHKNIQLIESDHNIIRHNTLIGSRWQHAVWGLQLVHSHNNHIIGNTISRFKFGLEFSVSNDNIAIENTISLNMDGIYVYRTSKNNVVYHNNLIENAWNQVVFDWARASQNIWDNGYPSGGNYWSDYEETDLYRGSNQDTIGSDGIGDTPKILGDSQDNYPLMTVWSSPDGLIQYLLRIVDEMPIKAGIKIGLTKKLDHALQNIALEEIELAIEQLNSFINQVNGLTNTVIQPELADDMISTTQRIISKLGS